MKKFLKKTKAMLPGNVSMHSGANYLNLAFWLCGFTWGVVSGEFPVPPPWSPWQENGHFGSP